jgi:hypothetical protein
MRPRLYTTPHGTAITEATGTPGVTRVYGIDDEIIGHITRLDAGHYEARATRSQSAETFEGSMVGDGAAWLTANHALWTSAT